MNERQELTARLAKDLEDLALQVPDGDARGLAYHDVVQVSANDVRTAALCQAQVAGQPEEFQPIPAFVTRALALSAGRRVHRVDGSLTEAVRKAMAESLGSERWPGTFLRDQPRDVRTDCAARAVTWLARTLDVLNVEDLRRWQFSRDLNWNYPGRGLRLRAKLDLLTPVTADHPAPVPVLIVANTEPENLASVAFTLLLLRLNELRPVDEARLVVHSSGEVLTLDPGEMTERGIEAIHTALTGIVARAAPATSEERDSGAKPPPDLDRAPSRFGCPACSWTGCPDRWEHRPAARSVLGGVRLRIAP